MKGYLLIKDKGNVKVYKSLAKDPKVAYQVKRKGKSKKEKFATFHDYLNNTPIVKEEVQVNPEGADSTNTEKE